LSRVSSVTKITIKWWRYDERQANAGAYNHANRESRCWEKCRSGGDPPCRKTAARADVSETGGRQLNGEGEAGGRSRQGDERLQKGRRQRGCLLPCRRSATFSHERAGERAVRVTC